MKAIYVQREPGQTVHNKSLEDDCGKFQIVEIVYENIQYWQDFDPDVHCSDTSIMWKLSCVEQKTDDVLRRPGYSLDKVIPHGMLINSKLHYINCTECSSGCEMSNDKVYMQWRELKGTPAQETPKKLKKPKGNRMKEISTKKENWKENHTNQGKVKRCMLYHLHSSCLTSAKINALKIFLWNLGKRCMHNIGVCNLTISAGSLQWKRFCH